MLFNSNGYERSNAEVELGKLPKGNHGETHLSKTNLRYLELYSFSQTYKRSQSLKIINQKPNIEIIYLKN